jgi:hypothetical protein
MGKSSKRNIDEAAPAAEDVPMGDATPKKKSKKDKKADDGAEVEVDLATLAEISKPLALNKTNKRVLKLVKKDAFTFPSSRLEVNSLSTPFRKG